MKINCIAIEDEPPAIKKLEGFIGQMPMLNHLGSFTNSIDGLNFLNQHTIDLLFLDINMDKLNGIELLKSLHHQPYVIITSAYAEYAIQGFELQVSDYLLKPYNFERFLKAVNKICGLKASEQPSAQNNTKTEVIFIRTAYQIDKINIGDILYIEGMKDYIGIRTSDKLIMCLQTFQSILQSLPLHDFVRVHKSYIVSLDKIDTIANHRIKIGEKHIPISGTYQKEFYGAVKQYRKLI